MKIRPSILVASISALVSSATTGQAVDYFFNVPNGDWATPGNWLGGVAPAGGATHFAYVNNGGTANINSPVGAIQDAFVGSGPTGVGTVNHSTGTLNASAGWLFVGINGGNGTWNMTGDSSLNTGRIYVGGRREENGGTGNMTINTTGTVTASSDVAVGTRGGNGVLNINNGIVNTAHWFIIGETINGTGGSIGTVNQTGGTVSNALVDANGRLWLGSHEGGTTISSTGTYNLSGGTLNARNASIGRHYIGNFTQTGGTANFFAGAAPNIIGEFAGSVGTYQLSGGAMNTSGGNFSIGEAGTGVLSISGTGSANITGTGGVRMGIAASGNGTLNLTGTTISTEGFVKGAGAAQVNIDGGTLVARAANTNYFNGFSDAQVNVQAGGLTFNSNGNAVTIIQGLAGAGGLTKTGNGTLTLTGAAAYAGNTTVNGGTLSIGNGGASGSLPATAVTVGAAGTLAFNRSDAITNTLVISGTGAVAQNGSNTLTVGAGFSGFSGAFNVNGGALVNTTATDLANAALSVNTGGRLMPLGNSVGNINTTGLTVGVGSTLDFDFSAGGATHDQIVSTGGITFAGAYTINLFDVGTANAFSSNGTYSLFDYATSVTGSPAGFTIGNAVNGKSYQLANNIGDTTVRMTIADAVLVAWNQTGGGLWSTNTNWTPNTVPNTPTADVNFGNSIAAPSTVDLDGSKTAGKLTFDSAQSYTIGGTGTLTLDNGLAAGSITVVSGNHTINTPLALPNASSVSTAPGTTLQVGDLSGAGALTKSGNGTLALNGTTGSTGGMIVNGGVVQVGTGGASGVLPTGNISLAAGTRISLNSTGVSTVTNNISGAGSISQDAAGSVTHSGTSTYTGVTDLNVGTFTNSGSLTGTSNIDINNATTFSAGSTTSTTGAIALGTGGTLTSTGNTTLFSRLTLNGGGAATIDGGNFRQTRVANESGFYVGENSAGTLNITGGVASAYEVWVGRNGGGAGTINLSGGRLDANHWTSMATVGGSTGTITHTGGTFNQNHTDWLSVAEGGTATYTMSGNALLNDPAVVDTTVRGTNKGNIFVGRNGGSSGVWTLNDNARANIRRLQVGNAANSTGEVNINNTSSVISSEDFHIAEAGTGTVNVNGGTLSTVSGWLQIGVAAGGMGRMNVSAGSVSAREYRVGVNGTGVVDVSGGTVTATQQVTVGAVGTTGNGTFNVRGNGTANFLNGTVVGGLGAGALTLSDNGTINATNTFIVGNGGTNAATATIEGGTLGVNGELWVGQAVGGRGTMNITNGTVTVNNWIAVGRDGATGSLNLSDSGSLIKTGGSHVIIGSLAGVGTFTQTGGTYSTVGAGETRLGENANGVGTWQIDGGVASTDAVRVGWVGGGSGNFSIGGTANVNIGAGGLIVSEGGAGAVLIQGGTTTIEGDVNMAPNVTSSGTFVLAGGTLDLTNGNVNFGPGTGEFAYADGILRGVANFQKALSMDGGIFEIGGLPDAGGITTINGDFAQQEAGTLELELAAGNIGDVLRVNGLVSILGELDLVPNSLAMGETFTILDNDGLDPITGEFIGRPDGQTFTEDGTTYLIDYNGGDGNDVVVQVVPEPGTVLTLIGGLGVLALRRRRKS